MLFCDWFLLQPFSSNSIEEQVMPRRCFGNDGIRVSGKSPGLLALFVCDCRGEVGEDQAVDDEVCHLRFSLVRALFSQRLPRS